MQSTSNETTVFDEAIVAFWAWVSEARADLEQLDVAASVERIHDHLLAIHPNLGVEVAHHSHPREVIFTAFADAELVPLVKTLVSAAPDLG